MNLKKHLNLSVPADIREWIAREARLRRMSISDYVLRLLVMGIQAETIDESVARLRSAAETVATREILHQVLALRYIVEAQTRGPIKTPATLNTEANAYADRELARYLPSGTQS